jgi:hypothetical protein
MPAECEKAPAESRGFFAAYYIWRQLREPEREREFERITNRHLIPAKQYIPKHLEAVTFCRPDNYRQDALVDFC